MLIVCGAWLLIGVTAVASILMYAGAVKLERRAALWDEYRHPPDSEVSEDE